MFMEGASPHRSEASTNKTTVARNSRTLPKRCDSQPVSGTEIAFATANEVITQVPWLGETPRSPAIAGMDTLAIETSRTFMNVASDTTSVPRARVPPASGGCAAWACSAMFARSRGGVRARGRGSGAAPVARRRAGSRSSRGGPPNASRPCWPR